MNHIAKLPHMQGFVTRPPPTYPKLRAVPGSGGSQQNLGGLGMNGGRDQGSRIEGKEGRGQRELERMEKGQGETVTGPAACTA